MNWKQVLCRLAVLLRVPAPTGFQIIERTTTPPSQRLGLYRFKGKDGKEGVPVDIQSILNGTAKFCRHCDVVILGATITKKAKTLAASSSSSSLPDPASSSSGSSSGSASVDPCDPCDQDDDDIHFCSSPCFLQFAVTHRVPGVPGVGNTLFFFSVYILQYYIIIDDWIKKKKKFFFFFLNFLNLLLIFFYFFIYSFFYFSIFICYIIMTTQWYIIDIYINNYSKDTNIVINYDITS